MQLSGDAGDDAPGPELIRLLSDLREVFGGPAVLWTRTILARLHAISGAPWPDWHGKPLSDRGLAGLPGPFGVKPRDVREGGYPAQNLKGYERSQLSSLWDSYLGRPAGPLGGSTPTGPGSDEAGDGGASSGGPQAQPAADSRRAPHADG